MDAKTLSERIRRDKDWIIAEGLLNVADEVAQLEAELEERTHQYHLAHAKILSREAIIDQLSESELAKDVTQLEAENERLREEVKLLDAKRRLANVWDALKEGE